jgi:hypothetical protein
VGGFRPCRGDEIRTGITKLLERGIRLGGRSRHFDEDVADAGLPEEISKAGSGFPIGALRPVADGDGGWLRVPRPGEQWTRCMPRAGQEEEASQHPAPAQTEAAMLDDTAAAIPRIHAGAGNAGQATVMRSTAEDG